MDSGLTLDSLPQDFISSMLPQRFALPYGFMRYIEENQTAKIYDKLIKTCKHFFYSKGFVVVAESYNPVYNHLWYWPPLGEMHLPETWQNQRHKLWIDGRIFVCSVNPSPIFFPLNSLIEKIYRCENISFSNQFLKYEELKILSEVLTFKKIAFSWCYIIDKNGAVVLLEDIIALFPNVTDFFIRNKKLWCSSKSAKALSLFSKLNRLMLWGIPEVFKIEDFIIYIKTHKTNEYYIDFARDTPATYVTAFKNAATSVYTNADSSPSNIDFYERDQE